MLPYPKGVVRNPHSTIPREFFQVATWAQRLQSFQHSPFEVDTVHSNTVFVESKDRFSVAVDLGPSTGLDFQTESLNNILRDQFPSNIGLRERRVGRQRFVEINFLSADERDQALLKPLVIQDQPLQVSRTLDSNANVVRIGIAEIPHEQEAILKPKLIDLLSQYGDIFGIGLRYIEDVSNPFLGEGSSPPILFSLVLEPFLLSVLPDAAITRYVCQSNSTSCSIPVVIPTPVKLLAYADDVVIFINSVAKFTGVQAMLIDYNAASNSLINYNKSVAFPSQGSLPSISAIRHLVMNEAGLR
ncbi:hypothetical protein A0J61_07084 [Choanephora cucurbitarum]|uniref:Reverse transcriptase domain-containing protein n=1 Tax=Choanephora cucurbitarum TaxID=101091 RepID=A0A1C7N720_9FUNG|nr:hypothetical protein A0J61_07084 [Choanephora cucurbitarum]